MLTLFGVSITNSLATLVSSLCARDYFCHWVGLAYYIPIGVCGENWEEDTATVSALMDIVGYAFGSIFFPY